VLCLAVACPPVLLHLSSCIRSVLHITWLLVMCVALKEEEEGAGQVLGRLGPCR
jgi:hypothetical protein